MTGRNPARLLAPLALVITTAALLMILAGGDGGPEGTSTRPQGTDPAPVETQAPDDDGQEKGRGGRRSYTVKPGDTPSGIAEEAGIPLQELLDLNPELDPRTLNPGQKLRLR